MLSQVSGDEEMPTWTDSKHFIENILKFRQILRWEVLQHKAILSMHLIWKCVILYFSTLVSSSYLNTGFFQVMKVCRRLKLCSAGVMCCSMFPQGRLWSVGYWCAGSGPMWTGLSRHKTMWQAVLTVIIT